MERENDRQEDSNTLSPSVDDTKLIVDAMQAFTESAAMIEKVAGINFHFTNDDGLRLSQVQCWFNRG